MDVRPIPMSSKDKLRNMEEELKKWRDEKKRQSIVSTKENQALNTKTPSVRKSSAIFTPSVAKIPQTTQVDHKFKRRSEVPVAPMTPSVRTESMKNESTFSDASMNMLKRKLELSFSEADETKSEKNQLLTAIQQQQATDQATIDRRLLLEKWRKEKEEQKQKEREKKRQSAQPRYNQPTTTVSPFHKKCRHAGPCDHEQTEFKTPAKPVIKKPTRPVNHQTSQASQNSFKFVPATEAMFSNKSIMFDPLSDPRRLTLGGVTARQLLSELTPKANVAAFRQLTATVANNSFFKRAVRKVAKEMIRHLAAKKCREIIRGTNYQEIMAQFDAMQYEASWTVVRKCAFYWLFRAKVEERHGDYSRVIGTFEAATRNLAEPIEIIHNGLQQFMATLRKLANQSKAQAAQAVAEQKPKMEPKPVEIKIEEPRQVETVAPASIEVQHVTDAVADLAIEETHEMIEEQHVKPQVFESETTQQADEETYFEENFEEEESTFYVPRGGLVVTPAKTPRSRLGFKKAQRLSMTPLGKPGRILVEQSDAPLGQPRALNFDRDSLSDTLTPVTDSETTETRYHGEDDVPMSDDVEEQHEQMIEEPVVAPVEDEAPTAEQVTLVFTHADKNEEQDTYLVLEKHKLSKKQQEEFGTDVALTPARRSVRLAPHAPKQDDDVAKMLEEAQYSYTPNKALKNFDQRPIKKGKKKILSSAEELMRTLHENKQRGERKKREKKAAMAEPITEEQEVEEAKRLSLLPGEILNAPEPVFVAFKKMHPSLYKQFQRVPSERGFGLYSDVVPVRDKAAHLEMPTPVRRSHRLHKK